MRKSEKHELIILSGKSLELAFQKYEEIYAELKQQEDFQGSDLSLTIHDSIKNLLRKIEANLKEQIDQNKLVDEFIFEYESVSGELGNGRNTPVRLKRLARRLLSNYVDFIEKVGGRKKLKLLDKNDVTVFEAKSKRKAYLFWLVGFFGILGLHRFYLGKTGTGFGWLLTGGVMGFGAIYDLFALSNMVDEQNAYNELKSAKMKQLSGG
ncbi:MAG: TM2 domain-containing protein [Balneolaceae bacterium]